MNSDGTSLRAVTMVLEETEDLELSPRILELRKKIHSEEYLNNAIQRIAQVISGKLIENPDELTLQDDLLQ